MQAVLQGLVAPMRPDELEIVRNLNNAALPAVNELSDAALASLVREAELALTLRQDGALGGFLIAFAPGSDYASPNYRWFSDRYPDFLYVDRIVVAPQARGQGLGRALYRAVFDQAAGRPLCCEVNLRPPNESSLRFHHSLSFREVGRQETEGGEKEVALLATAGLPD